MSKVETETWKKRTNWQGPDRRGEGDKGGKKGEVLVKEQL